MLFSAAIYIVSEYCLPFPNLSLSITLSIVKILLSSQIQTKATQLVKQAQSRQLLVIHGEKFYQAEIHYPLTVYFCGVLGYIQIIVIGYTQKTVAIVNMTVFAIANERSVGMQAQSHRGNPEGRASAQVMVLAQSLRQLIGGFSCISPLFLRMPACIPFILRSSPRSELASLRWLPLPICCKEILYLPVFILKLARPPQQYSIS